MCIEYCTPFVRLFRLRIKVMESSNVIFYMTCTTIKYNRDGTGRDFCDPTRPVTCLLNRPVDLLVDWRKLTALQHLHCESKKPGTTILSITSPNVDRFSFFFTNRFISKYATKSSLTIPPHLTCVAELPCETSVSANSENLMHASLSTTNHKVVVATCLRCGGLCSDRFSTNLLLSLPVKQF